jgi:hypothetical protein
VSVAKATGTLRDTVVPKLERSSAFKLDRGPNAARMRIVRDGIEQMLGWLDDPELAPAAAHGLRAVAAVLESTPGYRRALARNRNAFWQTNVGIARMGLDQAIAQLEAPAPEPEPEPEPEPSAPSLWDGAGGFIGNLGNIAIRETSRFMRGLGFRWIAAKAHHGRTIEFESLLDPFVRDAKGEGLVPVLWGWCEGDGVAVAQTAAGLIGRHGAGAYIANIEHPWMHGTGDHAQTARFAAELRRIVGDSFPLAVSALGGASIPETHDLSPWVLPLDYASLRQHDFDLMPQAFWNMTDPNLPAPGAPKHAYRPANTIHGGERGGYARSRIRPTYGCWEEPLPVGADQYLTDTPSGIVGFSIYLLEQFPTGNPAWQRFGQAITEGRAVR